MITTSSSFELTTRDDGSIPMPTDQQPPNPTTSGTCREPESETRTPTVYVAGPYSSNPPYNVGLAIAVAENLHRLGFAPFVPHLTHYWHKQFPHEYATWLSYDRVWLAKCDAVFRFPGYSPGADGEVALALQLGTPVFTDFGALCRWAWPFAGEPDAG